ncbi:membrane hypothetical protein [Burkholderiales bacterium 8X]|nr:membrane hypothetical protein [Burkholderiales bacterium 8X]
MNTLRVQRLWTVSGSVLAFVALAGLASWLASSRLQIGPALYLFGGLLQPASLAIVSVVGARFRRRALQPVEFWWVLLLSLALQGLVFDRVLLWRTNGELGALDIWDAMAFFGLLSAFVLAATECLLRRRHAEDRLAEERDGPNSEAPTRSTRSMVGQYLWRLTLVIGASAAILAAMQETTPHARDPRPLFLHLAIVSMMLAASLDLRRTQGRGLGLAEWAVAALLSWLAWLPTVLVAKLATGQWLGHPSIFEPAGLASMLSLVAVTGIAVGLTESFLRLAPRSALARDPSMPSEVPTTS